MRGIGQLSKHRWDAKNDKNQPEIVKELRTIPGLTVETGHDDLLVGYNGKTYFYEIKETPTSAVKDSQYKLIKDFTGHYRFAFSAKDILQDIGIERINAPRAVYNAVWHGIIRTGLTPARANKYAIRAMDFYKKNEFEGAQQLIEDMIEEAQK